LAGFLKLANQNRERRDALKRQELRLPVSAEAELRGCKKDWYKINKLFFFNCESCTATLVESQNKNIELEMSITGPL